MLRNALPCLPLQPHTWQIFLAHKLIQIATTVAYQADEVGQLMPLRPCPNSDRPTYRALFVVTYEALYEIVEHLSRGDLCRHRPDDSCCLVPVGT